MNDVVPTQIADIRKKMDEQVEEMKELSKATMSVVDKVKKLKIDEVSEHLARIDARLEVLDEHMAAVDKKIAGDGACAKRDGLLQQDAVPDKEEAMNLPDLPMKKEESHADEKVSNVIETTMDDKKDNDCVSETIKQYDNEKSAVEGSAKGGIFKKLMSKVLPYRKKDAAPQDPEKVVNQPVSVAPDINANKSAPCSVCESVEKEDAVDKLTMLEETVESSAVSTKQEAAPVEKPAIDLLAVDKEELRAKMEELIVSANQMTAERRYSDATEVYLKLSDAYEKNKDDSAVQELGTRINELYDKISSNLLNNLMTTDKGQAMPALGESKSV